MTRDMRKLLGPSLLCRQWAVLIGPCLKLTTWASCHWRGTWPTSTRPGMLGECGNGATREVGQFVPVFHRRCWRSFDDVWCIYLHHFHPVLHLDTAMATVQQPFGAEIGTTLVATRMATEICWQRGRSRVAGTLGWAADAWHVGRGDVSKLQIATKMGRKLFGAWFDSLWCAQRYKCCIVRGIRWLLSACGKGRNEEGFAEKCGLVGIFSPGFFYGSHRPHWQNSTEKTCSSYKRQDLATRGSPITFQNVENGLRRDSEKTSTLLTPGCGPKVESTFEEGAASSAFQNCWRSSSSSCVRW